jgi:hypothetical protein
MPDTGAPWNLPYPAPSDLVRDAPEAFEDLAEAVAAGLSAVPQTILQVVEATTTSSTTVTGTTRTDTALQVSITPSSTSSKVLLIGSCEAFSNNGSDASGASSRWRLYTPDVAGTELNVVARMLTRDTVAENIVGQSFVFVHSPATDVSITYRLGIDGGTSGTITTVSGRQSIIAVELSA